MLKHDRSTKKLRQFWISTKNLIYFGRKVFIKFLIFQAFGTFKLFVCFQHKSHSATPDTFRDSAKTFSDIAIYASLRIVSSVNSWVARLLRLPPTFRFVRLGVQRDNHCDYASLSNG